MKKLLSIVLFLVPSAAWATCNSPCVVSTGCTMTGGTTCTTPGVNTTGANFVIFGLTGDDPTGSNSCTLSVTDNKSNGASTNLVLRGQASTGVSSFLGYWVNPTVGSGHTWTVNIGACSGVAHPVLAVAAFSGIATSSPFDAGSDIGLAAASNTTINSATAGTFTPSQNCDVTFAELGLIGGAGGTVTAGAGMIIINSTEFSSGNNSGGTLAYIQQGAISVLSPSFTWVNSDVSMISTGYFKSASTACANSQLMLTGTGR